jgi:hypothetical protein
MFVGVASRGGDHRRPGRRGGDPVVSLVGVKVPRDGDA